MANDSHYHNGHGGHEYPTVPDANWEPEVPPAVDPDAPTQPLREDDVPTRFAGPDDPTWPPRDDLDAILRAQADREASHPPVPEVLFAYFRYNVQRLMHALVETLHLRDDH